MNMWVRDTVCDKAVLTKRAVVIGEAKFTEQARFTDNRAPIDKSAMLSDKSAMLSDKSAMLNKKATLRRETRRRGTATLCAIAVGFGAVASWNCAGSQTSPSTTAASQPAPASPATEPEDTGATEPSTMSVGPGILDKELLALSLRAKEVEQIKLRVDKEGRLEKLAVYHRDETVIPEAVMTRAKNDIPEATISRFETEHYRGKGLVYELVTRKKGSRYGCEQARSPEGEPLYRECKLDPRKLPETVQKAAQARVGKGKIVDAEEWQDLKDQSQRFEIEIRAEDKTHYLQITPGGNIEGHYMKVPAQIYVAVPSS